MLKRGLRRSYAVVIRHEFQRRSATTVSHRRMNFPSSISQVSCEVMQGNSLQHDVIISSIVHIERAARVGMEAPATRSFRILLRSSRRSANRQL